MLKVIIIRNQVFLKMIQLFSVQNISERCNLGKYLYLATKKRNESLP